MAIGPNIFQMLLVNSALETLLYNARNLDIMIFTHIISGNSVTGFSVV